MNKSSLLYLIEAYARKYPTDIHTTKTLAFLDSQDDFWQKNNAVGHITASAWIVNADFDAAILTHHLKLDKWFQLGGHVEESDIDIFDAIGREVTEESGLSEFAFSDRTVFDIDVHVIPISKNGFPAHCHYDIRALILADSYKPLKFDTSESYDIKWVRFDDIKNYTAESSILRMIQKTKQLLGTS